MDNLDIYIYLGSIECLKNDLPITNEINVKWVYYIISSNVDQHIALIVHFVGRFVITWDSKASNSLSTDIHADDAIF